MLDSPSAPAWAEGLACPGTARAPLSPPVPSPVPLHHQRRRAGQEPDPRASCQSQRPSLSSAQLDLASQYIKAAVKNTPTVFLMTDSQVAEEPFLVLINDFLASGEVPGLFQDDEVENILSSMRPQVKFLGLPDTRENCWKFFIDKVRRQLKVGAPGTCLAPSSASRVQARYHAGTDSQRLSWAPLRCAPGPVGKDRSRVTLALTSPSNRRAHPCQGAWPPACTGLDEDGCAQGPHFLLQGTPAQHSRQDGGLSAWPSPARSLHPVVPQISAPPSPPPRAALSGLRAPCPAGWSLMP